MPREREGRKEGRKEGRGEKEGRMEGKEEKEEKEERKEGRKASCTMSEWQLSKSQQLSVSKGVEKRKPSCTGGRIVN